MIKIRNCDLPAGVHVRTVNRGRHTVVFLLHGLTPAQRQAAIRRAKGAARVGQGPALPSGALARALAVDRLRTTVRNGFGAMRMHPAVLFPPLIIVLSAAVAYLLLVSVSIHYAPGRPVPGPVAIGASPAPGSAVHLSRDPQPGHHRIGTLLPSPGASPSPVVPGPTPRPAPSTGPIPAPVPTAPAPAPSSPAGPAPSPTSPVPPSSPPASKSQPPPSPSPSTSPPASGGGGGTLCVKVGPLGVCLGV
ncbi:MAG: hypothetical protein ABJB47_19730 [Actinomycetota bacterium]